MEQNPLSDEQLLKRIAEVFNKSEKHVKVEINSEMQKLRPKTVHTTPTGNVSNRNNAEKSGEPQSLKNQLEEITFRDAEDFKTLDEGLEIVNDKETEPEKVFITKTEKRCLEHIGNLASRTRAPLDDKHQRYFEKDRKKFSNKITMPETQEIDKTEAVPPEIISKTKETPVNLTSTELDGLRTYLLQLKELIARRETTWARTTERDYNQRVEITRFKNEVSHLRMLCEKRQREIKEKDQIIATKDEEIKELQKKVQGLRNAMMKLEKKDERIPDRPISQGFDILDNSKMIIKSSDPTKKPKSSSKSKEVKKNSRKGKSEEEESAGKPKSNAIKIIQDERLQKIEEILQSDVLKNKKQSWKPGKTQAELKSLIKSQNGDLDPNFQKRITPSSSKMRQETFLGAMGGLKLGLPDMRKPDLANNFLTARNAHLFNY